MMVIDEVRVRWPMLLVVVSGVTGGGWLVVEEEVGG